MVHFTRPRLRKVRQPHRGILTHLLLFASGSPLLLTLHPAHKNHGDPCTTNCVCTDGHAHKHAHTHAHTYMHARTSCFADPGARLSHRPPCELMQSQHFSMPILEVFWQTPSNTRPPRLSCKRDEMLLCPIPRWGLPERRRLVHNAPIAKVLACEPIVHIPQSLNHETGSSERKARTT